MKHTITSAVFTHSGAWAVCLSVNHLQVLLDLLCGLSHELAHFLVFGPVLHLTFPELTKHNNRMNNISKCETATPLWRSLRWREEG